MCWLASYTQGGGRQPISPFIFLVVLRGHRHSRSTSFHTSSSCNGQARNKTFRVRRRRRTFECFCRAMRDVIRLWAPPPRDTARGPCPFA